MTPAAAAARKAVQTRNATEEAILDAAHAALAERGYEGLTMDAIAKRAAIAPPTSWPTRTGCRPQVCSMSAPSQARTPAASSAPSGIPEAP